MKYSDETLMAYADGELDEVTRAGIERAMREDEALAARVQQHRALRADVFAAFAPLAQEPVPQRLQDVLRPAQVLPPEVTPIDIARAAREAARAAREAKRQTPPRRSWMQLGGIAAAALIGVVAGRQTAAPEADIASSGGVLVAQAGLAEALSQRLAGSAGAGAAQIGVSFVSKDGTYCRSFTQGRTAGLACNENGRWTLPVLAQAESATGDYRQAAAALPPAVLEAIDARIEGEALDAAGERAAASAGWRR